MLKNWFANANRWQVYRFTFQAVCYAAFWFLCASVLPFRTGQTLVNITHPIFAFVAIYGLTFRKPIQ